MQQTRVFPRGESDGPKTSEWPQFSGLPRQADLGGYRVDRSHSVNRHVTIGAIGSDIGGGISGATTPLISQSPDLSRRPSPPSVSSFSDAPSLSTHVTTSAISSARSVPVTPLNTLPNPAFRGELSMPAKSATGVLNSQNIHTERGISAAQQQDYQRGFASDGSGYSRPYDNPTFGSVRTDETLPSVSVIHDSSFEAPLFTLAAQHPSDTLYSSSGALDYQRQGANPYVSSYGTRLSGADVSGAFYATIPRAHGGPALGGGRLGGMDKMNGLGGPKHKRVDNERECERKLSTQWS